jgi:peptidoglycan/xylan/chitin deacetylase (PgdA/CDA1 family)
MAFSIMHLGDLPVIRLGLYTSLYGMAILYRTFFPSHLAILMYHGIISTPLVVRNWCFLDRSFFISQIQYLKKYFQLLSLSEAVKRMKNGGISRPTAVVTFDDGFQNNYDLAFPILREMGVPATIFLVTGLVNTDDTVWFCRLNQTLTKTKRLAFEWHGDRVDLSDPLSKAEAAEIIQEKLKEYPHPDLLAEVRWITRELGDEPTAPIPVGSPFRILSGEAIREMAASGLIEFGAHTHNHAILSRLSLGEQRNEIYRSVKAVHELTGRPCQLFAYPNGRGQDYDGGSMKILEECGVRASVTTIEGPNGMMIPLMELRRYGVGADMSLPHFQLKANHIIAQAQRMLRWR